MTERIGAVLDDEGGVTNLVVLPATDDELGEAWREQLPRVRVLTDDERERGVGPGWRRAGNGRWVDERPAPPADPDRPAEAGGPAPPPPATTTTTGTGRAAPR